MSNEDDAKAKKREYIRRWRQANPEKIAEARRQHYKANREKILEKNRQYREANREKVKEIDRQYYKANREKVLEKDRRYNEANQEKRAEIYRRYREANPDKVKEAGRRYREANPEKLLEKSRRYNKAHPEKARAIANRRHARKAAAEGSHTEAEWQALCSYYMDQCLSCGDVPDLLTRDHVIPLSKGGSDDISNIQPLCLSCNTRKSTKTIDYRLTSIQQAMRLGKNKVNRLEGPEVWNLDYKDEALR